MNEAKRARAAATRERLRQAMSFVRSHRLQLLLPVALAFLVHLPVLINGLVWDDRSLIVNNPRWGSSASPGELLGRDYGLELGAQLRGYYRPLFTLMTWCLYQIGGASPLIYHALALGCFCVGALVAWAFFYRTLPNASPLLVTFAAALCAVHPLHTEVVAIYASHPDWFCQMAMMVACLVVLIRRCDNRDEEFLAMGYAAYPGLFAGFMKETAFFILGALLLTVAGQSMVSPAHLRRHWHILILGLFLGLVMPFAPRFFVLLNGLAEQSLLAPFTSAGAPRALLACFTALRLLLIPTLTIFIRDVECNPSGLAVVAFVALLLAGFALWIWMLRSGRLVPAIMLGWLGAGLFNLSLATANGLPYSERYLSVIPAIYFLVLGLSKIPLPPQRAKLLAVALIAYCGIQTTLGTLKCADSVTFFASLHDERPNEIYGMTGLADALFWDKGDFENATRLAKEAIALKPNDPTVRTMGQLLARIALLEERPADAVQHLDWAEEKQPNYPIIENLRADALGKLGRIAEALEANQRAIKLDSENPAYRIQRARLLLHAVESNDEEVWRELQKAKQLGGSIPEDLDSWDKIRAARAGTK